MRTTYPVVECEVTDIGSAAVYVGQSVIERIDLVCGRHG